MHVAIAGQLPTSRCRPEGGVAAVVGNLIQGLVNNGVQVTAIQWGSSQAHAFDDDHLNCRVIPLRVRHPAVIANWSWTSRELNKILDDVRPDLVHIECVPELGWAVRHPRVLSIHGITYRDEWLYGKWQRYLTTPFTAATFWLSRRKFKHIIVHNRGVLEVTGPMRYAKLHEIENAIEVGFFHIVRRPFTPTVLFVGRLCALKNTLGLVRTAAMVRKIVPGVRFRLVGPWSPRDDPSYRIEVERFCEAERLEETVKFLGLLSREQVMSELGRAACLFLPSFQEMAPAVISEAMAAGVPVAASRISGIPYMVEDGRTGLLFDPRNLDEMAECLTRLLTDEVLRERMARESRRQVVDRHHPDAVARQHLAVYRQVIDDWRH